MRWAIGSLEYEIVCPDCPCNIFVYIPGWDAYRCRGCDIAWTFDQLKDKALLNAADNKNYKDDD